MMCEKVYQSEMCCEFSELKPTPFHGLTYPQLQIGTCPIVNRTTPATTTRPSAAASHGQVSVFRGLRMGLRLGFPRVGEGWYWMRRRNARQLTALQDAVQLGDQVIGLTRLHQNRGHSGAVGTLVDVGRPVGRHRDDGDT